MKKALNKYSLHACIVAAGGYWMNAGSLQSLAVPFTRRSWCPAPDTGPVFRGAPPPPHTPDKLTNRNYQNI